jgi:hypothetical protein
MVGLRFADLRSRPPELPPADPGGSAAVYVRLCEDLALQVVQGHLFSMGQSKVNQ